MKFMSLTKLRHSLDRIDLLPINLDAKNFELNR